MIRFRATSSILNNNTLWTDSNYTGSVIALNLTSSYSGKKNQVFADVISVKYNGIGSWILFTTSGSELPDESGQYDIKIFGAEGAQDTWGSITTQFGATDKIWGDVSNERSTGTLLSDDRAFISGSDYDDITKYNYQDKPVYSVYDG